MVLREVSVEAFPHELRQKHLVDLAGRLRPCVHDFDLGIEDCSITGKSCSETDVILFPVQLEPLVDTPDLVQHRTPKG